MSRVPENALKFFVGALLTTFGAFWSGEGVGVRWPGEDLAIIGVLAFVLLLALLLTAALSRRKGSRSPGVAHSVEAAAQ